MFDSWEKKFKEIEKNIIRKYLPFFLILGGLKHLFLLIKSDNFNHVYNNLLSTLSSQK
jgi:hypothetical protein